MTLARAASGLVFALVLFFTLAVARAAEVPRLRGHVNDYADVIAPEVEARLEKELIDYESATGRQYAVLTLPTLGGEDIEGFSIRTVEAWKLGQKKQDNGLLLLVVPGDRKTRIEVGYGLEGEITDARSSRIIREILSPAFRAGDFSGGIERALHALMGKTSQATPPPPDSGRARRRGPRIPVDLIVLVLFLFFPFIGFLLRLLGLSGRRGSRTRHWGAGFPIGGYWGGSSGRGWGGGGGFGGGGFSGGGGGFGGGGASGSW